MRRGRIQHPSHTRSLVGLRSPGGLPQKRAYGRFRECDKPGSKDYDLLQALPERIAEPIVNVSRPATDNTIVSTPFSHRRFPSTQESHHINDEPLHGFQHTPGEGILEETIFWGAVHFNRPHGCRTLRRSAHTVSSHLLFPFLLPYVPTTWRPNAVPGPGISSSTSSRTSGPAWRETTIRLCFIAAPLGREKKRGHSEGGIAGKILRWIARVNNGCGTPVAPWRS